MTLRALGAVLSMSGLRADARESGVARGAAGRELHADDLNGERGAPTRIRPCKPSA